MRNCTPQLGFISVGGQTYLLSIALVPTLPYPAVVGHDVPTLLDLIEQARQEKQLMKEGHIEGTKTPVQEVDQECQPHSQPRVPACNIVTTRAQKAKNTLEELPFFHVE